MNEILFILSILAAFIAVVLVSKFFGEVGLTVFISVAVILANIITAKQIDIFGLSATMGTVLFASVYLCTDIISEVYGAKKSYRAIVISLISIICYIIVSQIALLFTPNDFDLVSDSFRTVFSSTIRISAASVVMFFISNLADVFIFDKLKKKYPEKLWLRNNVATITCNCLENFLFIFLAFIGIYDFKTCCAIAATTSLIEVFVAVCDTPFVYLGRKFAKVE